MSNITVPRLIHHRRQAANGMSPSASFWNELRAAVCHLGEFGSQRQVYGRASELGSVIGVGATTTITRWRFRTGPYTSRVRVVLLLGASDDNGIVTISPKVEVDLKISGGATTTLGPFAAPIVHTITDAPDEHLLVAGDAAVTASTVYECSVRALNYARVLSILAYEEGAPGVDIVALPLAVAGAPIFDAHRSQLLVPLSTMHERCGGISAHWGQEAGAARTRTSATPINLIDNATTGTPTTAHPGWYLDTSYHQRASKTTVAFEFSAWASVTAGGNGTVRLMDTAGNTYGAINVTSTTASWVTATLNLPVGETFYAPQLFADGLNTLSCWQTSLIEYG